MKLTKERFDKLSSHQELNKLSFRTLIQKMADGKNFQEIIGLDSMHMQQLYDIADNYLHNKRYDEAADCFLFLAALAPFEARLWIKSGNAAQGLHRHDEALESYSMAMYADADDPFPHFYSAQIYADLGKFIEAKKCLEISLKITDEHEAFASLKPYIETLKKYITQKEK
jgi:type III secretion system low calcium response chaperone LcrH/SycD